MADSVGSLQLDISTSAKSVNEALNGLTTTLGKLKDSVNGFSFEGLNNGLTTFTDKINSITQESVDKITNISKVLENISNLKSNNTISEMADDIAKMSLDDSLNQFLNDIDDMMSELDKTSNYADKANEAVNNFADSGLTKLANKAVKAWAGLFGLNKALGSYINESNAYVENMNLFAVSLGKYAQEAENHAQQVSSVMGIDPGAWMRYQGTFNTIIKGFGESADKAAIMSQQLTQLGYDISSLYNIDYDQAMQGLQSGLVGQIKSVRQWGYDLSQANLEQILLKNGIEDSYTAMTQLEKVELRYHALMSQVTWVQGDMARTLQAPANQMRIFKAEVVQLGRAIGNILIPLMNKLMPVAIALANVLKYVANIIASFFGFQLPDIDYSGVVDSVGGGTEDIADNLGSAAKSAKKMKEYMLGIDELNVLSPEQPTSSGGGSGAGGGIGGGGLDLDLLTYDFIGNAVTDKLNSLVKSLKEFLGLDKEINSFADLITTRFGAIVVTLFSLATGFSALKNIKFFRELLGYNIIGSQLFTGISLLTTGLTLLVTGFIDANKYGLTAKNILLMVAGGISAIAGSLLLFKGSNLTFFTKLQDSIGLIGLYIKQFLPFIVGFGVALAGLFVSFKDIATNGPTVTNVIMALVTGLTALGTAILLVYKAYQMFGTAGGIISALVLVGTTIVTIAKAIRSAGEEAYKATDGYAVMSEAISRNKEIIDRNTEALETSKQVISTMSNDFKGYSDSLANISFADSLLKEIYDLDEKVGKTDYDFELMKLKIDILNGLGLEGLQLTIDETTGRIVESREQAQQLIDTLLEEAKVEAMKEMLVEQYKAQYQAEIDLQQATYDNKVATERLAEAQQEMIKFNQENPLSMFSPEYQALQAEIRTLEEAVSTTDQAMQISQETIRTSGEAVQILTDNLIGMEEVMEPLPEEAANVGQGIADGFANPIEDKLGNAEHWLGLFGQLEMFARDATETHSPSAVFSAIGNDIMNGLFIGLEEMLEKVLNVFQTVVDNGLEIFDNLKKGLKETMDQIWTHMKGVINSILGGIQGLVNGVANGMNAVIRALNNLHFTVPDWVPGMGGKSFGFNLPTITAPTIPLLATGGQVDRGQMFIANEAGPELVGNIGRKTTVANNEQIIKGISEGVRDSNIEVVSALYQLIDIVESKDMSVSIGDEEIGRSYDRYEQSRGMRVNTGTFSNSY